MVEQELNEWDEYGTRETGPERQSNDSASCVGGAKSPGDDRECNLSEDRCLEATDAGEQDVKDGDASWTFTRSNVLTVSCRTSLRTH